MSNLDLNLSKLFNFAKPAELNKNSNEYTAEEVKENFDLLQKDEKGNVSLEAGAKLFEMMYMDKNVDEAEDDFLAAMEAISGIDGDASSFSVQDFQGANEYFQNVLSDYATESEETTNNSKTDLEKKLGFDVVSTEDDKIKYNDDGSAYIEVEEWSSNSGKNDCLKRIIENNYDLDAMGIKKYSKEYFALEKEIMDANPHIYGEDSGRKSRTGDRNETYLHTGDKMVLPCLEKPKTTDQTQTAEDDKSVGGQTQELMSSDEISKVIDTLGVLMENGTPENVLSVIEDYSPENMLALIEQYEAENGTSFVSELRNKFTDQDTTALLNNIAEDVSAMVLKGDDAAIKEMAGQVLIESLSQEIDGAFTKALEAIDAELPADIKTKIQDKAQEILAESGFTSSVDENTETDDKAVGNGSVDPEQLKMNHSPEELQALVNSMDANLFASILENPDYTSADIAKIFELSGEDSLLKTYIQDAFSGDDKKEQRQEYYDKAVNALLDMTMSEDPTVSNQAQLMLARELDRCPGPLVFNSLVNTENVDGLNKVIDFYQNDSKCGGGPGFSTAGADLYDLIKWNTSDQTKAQEYTIQLMNKIAENAKDTGLSDNQIKEFAENLYDFTEGTEVNCLPIVKNFLENENISASDKYKIMKQFDNGFTTIFTSGNNTSLNDEKNYLQKLVDEIVENALTNKTDTE